MAAPAHAQNTSKPPDQAGQGETLHKKSFLFPDIATSNEPLSVGQKFGLFVTDSIGVRPILFSAVSAAVSQADNSPTGWGQGWDAYGNRFGSSMARNASGEFFGTFILSSAMHYDPRFFPDKDPTFGQAFGHSLKRVFITRSDAGKQVFDFPGLMGPLMGEGLANVYWPDQNRTVGDTFMRYGLDIATKAGGNLLREYWPVIQRKFSHSSSAQAARLSEIRTGQ